MAVRLADLLAGLSRLADLGFGLEVGAALRSCALATRLSDSLGCSPDEARGAFYTALLHHVGCAGYSHETARLLGDDIAANTAAGRTDAASPTDVVTTFLPTLTRGRPLLERARLVFVALTRGNRWGDEFTATACDLGRDTARRLGLPDEAQAGLFHVYDLWSDGRDDAQGGEAIPIAARIARLTGIAVLFASLGGTTLAVDAVRRRSGGMLDPVLVSEFARQADAWLAEVDDADLRTLVLDAEPSPPETVDDISLVAGVFGDLADLKSPYLVGHSRGVASLAAGAAARLAPGARSDLEVAGLLHDVGRAAVSSGVWDKPGPLNDAEREQVRLHPYYSERILAGSVELSRLAPLVGRHHERLDGTGYHRGSDAADLSTQSRILAAADTFRAMTERRPHRIALSPAEAERELVGEAEHGRLDPDAVQAVLEAAGRRVAVPSRRLPEGLSEREAEVLALLAGGCSNAQIAARLVISRRTAEHHVQHIYTKIGVSSRAAATLFALDHHLLERNG
ncbi:MAG TPA: HD domain-containing phosphohydrolase [Nocardioidaceae bacterium]|nr:HD domain-containing phosphohydrolase [Nocardioidaceae bacterium]